MPERALGVAKRNNLPIDELKKIHAKLKDLEKVEYDLKLDKRPTDDWCPLNPKAIQLPDEVKIFCVRRNENIKYLKELIGSPLIGMDTEWRPQIDGNDP